jgi:predicted ABC-type ATPase
MPAQPPTIYLIAGCNGAGKTTFAREFLPNEVKCLRFLNADEMARGLSPLDPAAGAAKAARLLLREVSDAIRARQTFALETTLSGITYARILANARRRAYAVKLLYLWLPSVALAIRRVRERVRKGGHSVPVADIRRRYTRSLRNLVSLYLPLAEEWTIFDNSGREPRLVADGTFGHARVMDEALYLRIHCHTEERQRRTRHAGRAPRPAPCRAKGTCRKPQTRPAPRHLAGRKNRGEDCMTAEMRKLLARLPCAEKLRRVAGLVEFARKFKAVKSTDKTTLSR